MVRTWLVVAGGRNSKLSGIDEACRMQTHGVHATPPTQTAKFGPPNAHRTISRAINPKSAPTLVQSCLIAHNGVLRAAQSSNKAHSNLRSTRRGHTPWRSPWDPSHTSHTARLANPGALCAAHSTRKTLIVSRQRPRHTSSNTSLSFHYLHVSTSTDAVTRFTMVSKRQYISTMPPSGPSQLTWGSSTPSSDGFHRSVLYLK